ncbi:MAG: hypothetical protein IKS41_04205 [Alphaproteobacteria bacterium]|nr:hypothetical protein [Alphaproteobacteria bacterium]
MYEDIESMTPAGGNTMPSRHRLGSKRGTDVDSVFRSMDREELLRKVSAYPPCVRRKLLNLLSRKSYFRG